MKVPWSDGSAFDYEDIVKIDVVDGVLFVTTKSGRKFSWDSINGKWNLKNPTA
jgi:hypothetical protein